MADYYPLISRAIGGLDKSTVESRAALYERARAALIGQLRASDPALDESEITRERLALEDAIRRVEADAVHASRADPPAAETVGADKDDNRRSSLRDEGLRNFREVMAQAEDLGGAAAQASKSARNVLDAVPAEKPQEKPAERPPRKSEQTFKPAANPPARGEADVGPAPAFVAPASDEAEAAELAEPEQAKKQASPRRPPPPPEDEVQDVRVPARSWRAPALIALLLLAVAAIGGLGYWQRHNIKSLFASSGGNPPAASGAQQAAAPKAQPKIVDRVGPSSESPAPAKPATAPAASVAQKVVLYDEDPNDPKGKRYVGSAIWRTETVSPGTGLAPELAVRADVEIPERHMRMTWSLRRNTDKALPASHTIEIMFTLPADFSEGGIANIPGVLMKTSEQARGVPLAGLSVKVTNGYFLIGLSAVDIDVQRNVQFLKERDWFDIPIVYNSGKRAILAMEKGPAGVRAFQEAFKAWGE
ncbi:MAG TPA: hypothetical protein VFL51_13435 [Pseudolabrys sp.]|nr:hypothetical protein [Pseudolabrys sp.]